MGCRTAVVNAETPFRHTELARIPEEQLRSRWYPIFEERSWDCESCRKLTMGSMYQCRNCMRCLCQACFCAFPHAAVERCRTVTCRPCLAENPTRLTCGCDDKAGGFWSCKEVRHVHSPDLFHCRRCCHGKEKNESCFCVSVFFVRRFLVASFVLLFLFSFL